MAKEIEETISFAAVYGKKGQGERENPIIADNFDGGYQQQPGASEEGLFGSQLQEVPVSGVLHLAQQRGAVGNHSSDTPLRNRSSTAISYEDLFVWRLFPLVVILIMSWLATVPVYKDFIANCGNSLHTTNSSYFENPQKQMTIGKHHKLCQGSSHKDVHLRSRTQQPLVAGALCGCFSCLLVMYQYLTRKSMQSYPGPLLIRQTVADFIVSTVLLTLYFPIVNTDMAKFCLLVFIILVSVSSLVMIYVSKWLWLFRSYVLYACILSLRSTKAGKNLLTDCFWPSLLFTLALHMSIWRLPLISTDLYRTTVNPFLNFRKAMTQYDFAVYGCMAIVFMTFMVVEAAWSSTEECSLLGRTAHYAEEGYDKLCGMTGLWYFGNERQHHPKNEPTLIKFQKPQPRICFVSNRYGGKALYRWLFPSKYLLLNCQYFLHKNDYFTSFIH